uniref:Uncharacterized protein n=1 Tax=Populus trichocarpa TaxID=3694 RepID=A0A2K1XE74_POPTR
MLKIWKFSTISALSSSTGCGFSLAKIFRARELSVVDTLFKTNPRAYLIIVLIILKEFVGLKNVDGAQSIDKGHYSVDRNEQCNMILATNQFS